MLPDHAVTHDGVEGFTVDARGVGDIDELAAATALLDQELPDHRFVDTDYLRWAYRDNPLGAAIERYQFVDQPDGELRLAAHYLNMPRRYRGPDATTSDGAWSLNAVVHNDHQRARHFSRIGVEIYDEAAERGWSFVVGVTNAKSTGAVVKYMGWRLVGPLPVRLIDPVGRGTTTEHISVDANWLDSDGFVDFANTVDRHRVEGWSTDYTSEILRWRLACPHTNYVVHISDDVALITTRSNLGPIPACVVLKAFPLVATEKPLDATRAVRSAIRWHRAGFGVYAGFNRLGDIGGVAPPRRLQPSPLNLIVRHLDPVVDQDAIDLDTFEFLDMDAY